MKFLNVALLLLALYLCCSAAEEEEEAVLTPKDPASTRKTPQKSKKMKL
jgi:hypothetical protein